MTDELETMPALAEWRDGDPELLAQGRADVPPDARRAGGPYSRERTLVTKSWG